MCCTSLESRLFSQVYCYKSPVLIQAMQSFQPIHATVNATISSNAHARSKTTPIHIFSHRNTAPLRSLPPLLYHFLDNKLANLSGHSTAFGLTAISLADGPLFGWSDKTVDGPVIKDSFLLIVLPFLVRLRPHVSIQFTMSLASRTR
jgi:hypothetical protein